MKDDFTPISSLPIIGPILRKFDQDVGKHGFQEAFKIILDERSIKYIGDIDEETAKVLKHDKVLLIVNHDNDFEMVPLYALLPSRKDTYLIGAAHITGIGPNTAEYILTIYLNQNTSHKEEKMSYRLARHLNLFPKLLDDEAHKINIETINQARQKINQGGLVMLFPSGVGKKGAKWKNGVGILVHSLDRDAYIVFANVKGTTPHDAFRLIPHVNKFFPEFKISFSKPKKVGQLINEQDPRIITKDLENQYKIWMSTLTTAPK